MQNDGSKTPRLTASDLVVALFTDGISASDAVADLQLAGFDASHIAIALSAEGKRQNKEDPEAEKSDALSSGQHGFMWKLRHSVEHDTHAHGFGLDSKADANKSQSRGALYSEVDLEDTLLGLGVAEDRVRLLDREIGPNGMLVLVDAGGHAPMVQSILEKNRGFIRTDMATERAPAT